MERVFHPLLRLLIMKMTTVLAAVTMALGGIVTQGCAESAREAASARAEIGELDGHSYRVVAADERGGAPSRIELAFVRGTFEASDTLGDGYVPTRYTTHVTDDALEFDVESRSPSAVRRFTGRVAGKHVEGTIVFAPHGSAPRHYVFSGDAT
jgi:hypothetical protein